MASAICCVLRSRRTSVWIIRRRTGWRIKFTALVGTGVPLRPEQRAAENNISDAENGKTLIPAPLRLDFREVIRHRLERRANLDHLIGEFLAQDLLVRKAARDEEFLLLEQFDG